MKPPISEFAPQFLVGFGDHQADHLRVGLGQLGHALGIVHEQGHLGTVVPGKRIDDVDAGVNLGPAVQAGGVRDTSPPGRR